MSYGGENGFNQAIELAAESLQNVKFIQEKKLIGRYFDEISQVSLFKKELFAYFKKVYDCRRIGLKQTIQNIIFQTNTQGKAKCWIYEV